MSDSYALYNILRQLCVFNGIPVHEVSRKTLYNWKCRGVAHDDIDLLRLRLAEGGFLTRDAFDDLALSLGYYGVFGHPPPGASGPAPGGFIPLPLTPIKPPCSNTGVV